MWLFHTTDYDMSDEIVKECLSHWYVMKLHRHTSSENHEMTTNNIATICGRWCRPWWHICDEWIHMYTLQKELMTKKQQKMPDQACANWSAVTWHPIGFTEHIAIGEEELFLLKYHS